MTDTSPRSMRVLAGAELVATIVVLNLCFLATSLAVVTVLPSALALQATLPRPGVDTASQPVRRYFRTFVAMCRSAWVPGILLPLMVFGVWVATSFYLAAAPALALPALVLLVPAFGFLTAGYLALLEVARLDPAAPTGWRAWIAPALHELAARPLPAAGAVLLLGTAAMLMLRLPTLLPIACGILPAYIAMWAFDPAARRRTRPVTIGR